MLKTITGADPASNVRGEISVIWYLPGSQVS